MICETIGDQKRTVLRGAGFFVLSIGCAILPPATTGAAEPAAAASHPATLLTAADQEFVRKIECMDHLRRIGLAIFQYSSDHGGRTPPDLGTLMMAEHLDLPMFVCPLSASAIPRDWPKLKPQEQAAWINAHTDYIYLAAKRDLNALMGAQGILVVEKEDDHAGGDINVLDAGGQVQSLSVAQVRHALGKATDAQPKTTRVPLVGGQTVHVPDITLDQAKTLVAKAEIDHLDVALEVFEIDQGRFPTQQEGLDALVHKPPGDLPNWRHPYLATLPLDPWGHPYIYAIPGPAGRDFTVTSAGPDGKPGMADDVKAE